MCFFKHIYTYDHDAIDIYDDSRTRVSRLHYEKYIGFSGVVINKCQYNFSLETHYSSVEYLQVRKQLLRYYVTLPIIYISLLLNVDIFLPIIL